MKAISAKWLKWVVAGLIALIFLLSINVRLTSDAGSDGPEPESTAALYSDPLTGALLIDFEDDADSGDRAVVREEVQRALEPFEWTLAAALGQEISADEQLYRLEAPASEVDDIIRTLRDNDELEGVEVERSWSLPDHLQVSAASVSLSDASPTDDGGERFEPNDPYYKHQWHLDQIQMPEAWNQNRGAGAVVAVIDTGVAFEDYEGFGRAPDLADTRFVPGYDFVSNDAHANDEHGHGTHVAGTIAQSTNNEIGVAGVAPEAAIMPLKVLDRNGRGGWGAIAAAIRWAADHDADVINMSLGGGMPSQTVRRAIDYAHDKGVVIIAAAGNSSRSRVEYPAMHRHVIAVGAVRFDEQLTFYSCYGKGLDLVAPGGDLRVDQNEDGLPDGVLQNTLVRGQTAQHDYLAYQGTSMAAPHVAGVAALLTSAGIEDPDAVEEILTRTAKDQKDRRRYAAGVVQANDALLAAKAGLGGTRGGLALLLGAFLLIGLRRREKLGVSLAPSLAVSFVLAGGLAFLTWVVGGWADPLVAGVPGGLTSLLGTYLAPVALSAGVPLLMAALFLGVKRAGPIVVGTALAFAAWLGLEAIFPTREIALIPELLVGPWLLLNAGVALLVAKFAAHKRVG